MLVAFHPKDTPKPKPKDQDLYPLLWLYIFTDDDVISSKWFILYKEKAYVRLKNVCMFEWTPSRKEKLGIPLQI